MKISQFDLITALLKALTKQKVKELNARQYNTVIKAADLICDALAKEHVSAKPGMGLEAWLASDDTGMSSEYMAYCVTKESKHWAGKIPKYAHPHDPSDLYRCINMVDAIAYDHPGLLVKLKEEMPTKSEHWKAIMENWNKWASNIEANSKLVYQEMKALGL